jgi:UDP:flavonoid glycosyltransferase YjiC (YdhE family)
MLRDLPSNVRVVESVPLDALLPTCQAIIHQGGAGTTFTALRNGLPQIVLTQLVDQAANACRLAACGAGRTRPVSGLGSADVVAIGHELLDQPGYRAAAENLRQEILDQPSPAEVVRELAALV